MKVGTFFLLTTLIVTILAIATVIILLIKEIVKIVVECYGGHLRFYVKIGPFSMLFDSGADELITKAA